MGELAASTTLLVPFCATPLPTITADQPLLYDCKPPPADILTDGNIQAGGWGYRTGWRKRKSVRGY